MSDLPRLQYQTIRRSKRSIRMCLKTLFSVDFITEAQYREMLDKLENEGVKVLKNG